MVPRLKCRIGIEPELAVGSVARYRRRGSPIFLSQRGSPELALSRRYAYHSRQRASYRRYGGPNVALDGA
jgi:hypothetical protein